MFIEPAQLHIFRPKKLDFKPVHVGPYFARLRVSSNDKRARSKNS